MSLDARYSLLKKKRKYKYVILGPPHCLIFHSFISCSHSVHRQPRQSVPTLRASRILLFLPRDFLSFHYTNFSLFIISDLNWSYSLSFSLLFFPVLYMSVSLLLFFPLPLHFLANRPGYFGNHITFPS